MSSYSSSNLDEPSPAWTAYRPKHGIAWAPRMVHVYDDKDENDSDPEERRPHRPLRRRSSALNISGSLSSVFGSLTNLLSTPKLSRKNSTKKAFPESRLKSRSMSESTLLTQTPTQGRRSPHPTLRRNRNLSSCSRTTSGLPAGPFRISDSSWDSLPSMNSDGAKSSSVDSPDGSTKAMDTFDDLSGGSGSGGGVGSYTPPPRSSSRVLALEAPSFTDLDQDRRGLQVQDLVSEDVGNLAIDRRYLRTGRLVLNDYNKAVCCGCLRTKSLSYSSRTRAVTIHIHKGLNNRDAQKKLIQNVASMRRLRHLHVAEVMGLCIEGSPYTPGGTEVLVVTERAHFHLTLRRLVLWAEDNNQQLLSPQVITSFGIHICHGLRYLEKHKVLHTNLTTATVLIDSRCVCKLYDMDFHSLEDRSLNTRWLPIETFLQSIFTFKSVVWSFGVVLWEMVSLCQQPYPHLSTLNDIILYLAHGKRLIRPESCPKKLYRIMCACWEEKPRNRPSLEDLIVMMTSYKQTLPPGKPPEEVFPDRDDFWEDNSWMDELDGVYDITMI